MKVLIGCEESQVVCMAFREAGHEAYSCDLKDCSGGHPEWHFKEDVFKVIEGGGSWDLFIAHPPCTFLTVTANRWLADQPKRKSGKLVGSERREARKEAIIFFEQLLNVNIKKIAIENPIGCMNSLIPPTQIVHPYYFGDPTPKATCLWLRGLPKLTWVSQDSLFEKKTAVEPEYHVTKTGKKYPLWSMIQACKIKDLDERSAFRSKTFPGIAKAMAQQWGNI